MDEMTSQITVLTDQGVNFNGQLKTIAKNIQSLSTTMKVCIVVNITKVLYLIIKDLPASSTATVSEVVILDSPGKNQDEDLGYFNPSPVDRCPPGPGPNSSTPSLARRSEATRSIGDVSREIPGRRSGSNSRSNHGRSCSQSPHSRRQGGNSGHRSRDLSPRSSRNHQRTPPNSPNRRGQQRSGMKSPVLRSPQRQQRAQWNRNSNSRPRRESPSPTCMRCLNTNHTTSNCFYESHDCSHCKIRGHISRLHQVDKRELREQIMGEIGIRGFSDWIAK